MFENVEKDVGDPIFSFVQAFNADKRTDKINLSIGLYQNENGMVPQLQAIKEAKKRLRRCYNSAPLYLPIEGLPGYRRAIGALLFGENSHFLQQDRLATVQAIGGTGALSIGASFLQRYFPDADVWVSDPTWKNHHAIFQGVGFKVNTYPYFDAKNKCIRFDALCETLNHVAPRSIILFHPCCHNPTGADLSHAQWDTLVSILKARDLIPFLDIAYQGLAEGLMEDCYEIKTMADADLSCFVSHSFSKIFSLYGERVGSLSIICKDSDEKKRVLSQLKVIIRRTYSNPPSYGARQVEIVLSDPALFACWSAELTAMRLRIVTMRKQLVAALSTQLPNKNFSYLLTQRGMFSYTGLSERQVAILREQYGIYLINSGRMSVAGLNDNNIDRVVSAIAAL